MSPAPAPSAPIPDPEVTPSMVRQFLRRRWHIILLVFLTTVLASYTVLAVITEQYQTESKVLVKLGPENVDPPATARGAVLVTGLRLQDAVNEVQILKSRDLAMQVVSRLGLEAFQSHPVLPRTFTGYLKYYAKSAARAVKGWYNDALVALDMRKHLSERDEAIETVLDSTVAEPERDSDVIALRTRLSNPLLSEAIQNELLSLYMARRNSLRADPGVEDFLDSKVAEADKQLRAVESQKRALRSTRSISSVQDQQALLLRQQRSLDSDIALSNAEIASLEKQARELRGQLAQLPEQIRSSEQDVPNPLVASLRERLATLKTQLSTLLTKYQPQSATVTDVNHEIQDLEAQLAKESSTIVGSVTFQVNPLRQNVDQRLRETQTSLAGQRAKLSEQQATLKATEIELTGVNRSQDDLVGIDRSEKIREETYLDLVKRAHEARVSSQLTDSKASNVSLLQPPVSSPNPVYPPKMLTFYISLGMGIALGLLLALFVENGDQRVWDARSLERTSGLPYLGVMDARDRRPGV